MLSCPDKFCRHHHAFAVYEPSLLPWLGGLPWRFQLLALSRQGFCMRLDLVRLLGWASICLTCESQ